MGGQVCVLARLPTQSHEQKCAICFLVAQAMNEDLLTTHAMPCRQAAPPAVGCGCSQAHQTIIVSKQCSEPSSRQASHVVTTSSGGRQSTKSDLGVPRIHVIECKYDHCWKIQALRQASKQAGKQASKPAVLQSHPPSRKLKQAKHDSQLDCPTLPTLCL